MCQGYFAHQGSKRALGPGMQSELGRGLESVQDLQNVRDLAFKLGATGSH